MQYYVKQFFVLYSSEVIFSFLVRQSRQKAIERENCIFSFPCESQGSHIGSFLLCFTYPSWLSLQTNTYIDQLVEIFLKLSVETVQVHLIIWMTLIRCKMLCYQGNIEECLRKFLKVAIKGHYFYQIHFIWQFDMKYESSISELTTSLTFSLIIPLKVEKLVKSGIFTQKAKNDVITWKQ